MQNDSNQPSNSTTLRRFTDGRSTFEIRQLIQSMMENCSFETRLLETTNRLLKRDLYDDVNQMNSILNKSVSVRVQTCCYCQKTFYDNKKKIVIFACGHIFHTSCLIEIKNEWKKYHSTISTTTSSKSINIFDHCPECSTTTTTTTASTTNSLQPTTTSSSQRRLTRIAAVDSFAALNTGNGNEKETILNIQQQVIDTMLERKRLNVRQLLVSDENNNDNDPANKSYSLITNTFFPQEHLRKTTMDLIPDKWREYLSETKN
ncbi:unnamed protein product [Didymodactylos carnosus]|nr:unnamed protein product [Didymodactylos carnosus]CAF4356430.1 unnamed protein product [Didymodactylos carnosus]